MNMIGAFAVMRVLGAIWWEIGERVPVVNTLLGGGAIATIFGMAAMVHWHILPKPAIVLIKILWAKWFSDFYIAALITGSILGMSRKLLIAAFAVIFRLFCSGSSGSGRRGSGGALIGYVGKKRFYTSASDHGGGMAPEQCRCQRFSRSTGMDPAKMLSMMIPAVALGNAMAILPAGC